MLYGCIIGQNLIAPIDILFLIIGKCGTRIVLTIRTGCQPMPVSACGKRTVPAEHKRILRPTAETVKGIQGQVDGEGVAVKLLCLTAQTVIIPDRCKIGHAPGAVMSAAAARGGFCFHDCIYPAMPSIARISAALVSGLTFGMTASITPFSSIRNVVRTTPIPTLPAIFFSCQTP